MLTPTIAIGVLERYIDGELKGKVLESWGDAIEGRDDIAFPPLFESVLSEPIFEISNPAINNGFSSERAAQWIQRLGSQ